MASVDIATTRISAFIVEKQMAEKSPKLKENL